jgi:hypothetical protein
MLHRKFTEYFLFSIPLQGKESLAAAKVTTYIMHKNEIEKL